VVGLLAVASPLRAAGPDEPPGWRVGPAAWSFNRFTFFKAVDKTAALGLRYIEAFEKGGGSAKRSSQSRWAPTFRTRCSSRSGRN